MNQLDKQLPKECIEAKNSLPTELRGSPIIQEIIIEIYNGWPGKTGIDRVVAAMDFISERLPQYAALMEKPLEEVLAKMCAVRRVNYTNWFQDAYVPDLSGVLVFENTVAFLERFPSRKFRCPSCNGISLDPQTCKSGLEMAKGKVCDWKVYGLLGGLGKEVRVVIKDQFWEKPKVLTIFPPVELIRNRMWRQGIKKVKVHVIEISEPSELEVKTKLKNKNKRES